MLMSVWLQAASMTRVRWFAVPSLTAQTPADPQEWFWTPNAIITSTEDLTQLVLAEATLPPSTALWLQTGLGWERVSSLAEVPHGDLVVKAVMGQSGGNAVCITRPGVGVCNCRGQPSEQDNLSLVRGIDWGCGRAATVAVQLPW